MTTITPSWEERFDEELTVPNHPYRKLKWGYQNGKQFGNQNILIEKIKSFIAKEKALSEKEGYEKGLADNQKKGEEALKKIAAEAKKA